MLCISSAAKDIRHPCTLHSATCDNQCATGCPEDVAHCVKPHVTDIYFTRHLCEVQTYKQVRTGTTWLASYRSVIQLMFDPSHQSADAVSQNIIIQTYVKLLTCVGAG